MAVLHPRARVKPLVVRRASPSRNGTPDFESEGKESAPMFAHTLRALLVSVETAPL